MEYLLSEAKQVKTSLKGRSSLVVLSSGKLDIWDCDLIFDKRQFFVRPKLSKINKKILLKSK